MTSSDRASKSQPDSATESDSDLPSNIHAKGKERALKPSLGSSSVNLNAPDSAARPATPKPISQPKVVESDSESSPARPSKKPKLPASSTDDDDSEAERKRRVALLKGGSGAAAKRGTKQPVKRGGKRF